MTEQQPLSTGNAKMDQNLSSSVQKVQDVLNALGSACRVVEMPQPTRTASDAARAVGCEAGQIVKSLIFKGKQSGRPVSVATSGVNGRVEVPS